MLPACRTEGKEETLPPFALAHGDVEGLLHYDTAISATPLYLAKNDDEPQNYHADCPDHQVSSMECVHFYTRVRAPNKCMVATLNEDGTVQHIGDAGQASRCMAGRSFLWGTEYTSTWQDGQVCLLLLSTRNSDLNARPSPVAH
jgi:hypothetical protein